MKAALCAVGGFFSGQGIIGATLFDGVPAGFIILLVLGIIAFGAAIAVHYNPTEIK